MSTYGVTVDDIRASVHNLTILDSTTPSISTVEEIIAYYGSEIAREMEVVGIDAASLDSSSDEYRLARRNLIYGVLSEILISRDRGRPEAGGWYTERYAQYIRLLRSRPQVAADKDQGPNQARSILDSSNPYPRTFASTMAGKITTGGL